MSDAIKQAIEALESCTDGDYLSGHVIHPHFDRAMVDSALAVLHAALAQPEPQNPPVNLRLMTALLQFVPVNVCLTNTNWPDTQVIPLDVTMGEMREAAAALAEAAKGAQPEPHPDDKAVADMAAAMKEKLAQAREKGRGGWETCSQQDLSRLLREHVEKGDPRDVANFCAFLHALGFGIAQPEPVEPAKQWVMTAPDGTTFSGDTPLRAATQASKYRLEIDPVAAKKFLDAIETIRQEGEEEHDRCMKEYGTLNCPACGGSGHIGDVTDGDTLAEAKVSQPEPVELTDEQDRALCEAYCNTHSDEYFKARPQLDSDVNRRIFYAGHRKAWITVAAAKGGV